MPQDPKLERVPTFLETLIQSLLPNMADPVAMEDNARLLQQGGSGNTPERMKKILTVAGRGVADAAFGAAKSQVPESPEDIALQFGPLGPAVGKAIGIVHPTFIRPLVERLKGKVAQEFPSATTRHVIERAINDNPRVASHLTRISPIDPREGQQGYDGLYYDMWRSGDSDASMVKNMGDPAHPSHAAMQSYLAGGSPNWWGGRIELAPQVVDPERLADVMRHEMNHAAQDVAGQLPAIKEWSEDIDYWTRPQEIGSRISEQRGRVLRQNREWGGKPATFDYKGELERQLQMLEQRYTLDPTKFPDMNSVLMFMNEDMKKRGYRIVTESPKISIGSGSISPQRKFKIERIVLDKP